MSQINIGVIGAGARGETFARQLYQGMRRARLFGVCDIDAQRLETFCNYCELHNTRRFTDLQAFVNDPQLDAVIITVPEFAHADVAVAALEAGKPVYIEKPLAHNHADCVRIIEASRRTGVLVFVGFNLRASPTYEKFKEVVASGVLGTLVHAAGAEILSATHGASFMRRFHRSSARSGGLLNHKCCHDIDILLWSLGHPRLRRIASFGGTRVFTPDKQPATHCSECPAAIYEKCAYKAGPGFVFPVRGDLPLYHPDQTTYGGDLCVYNSEKDLVDHQQVLMEFDNGLCASFTLEMFGSSGRRQTVVRGEKGVLEFDSGRDPQMRLTTSDGDTSVFDFTSRKGGHGGTDPKMIGRFVDAIESGQVGDSGLEAGLAAAIMAFKADEARLSGKMLDVDPQLYI